MRGLFSWKDSTAMADDDTTTDTSATDDDKPDTEDLGEGGKRALEAERKARKAAEKAAKDLEARLKELEDKDKSDTEKLSEKAATAEKRAIEAELRATRLEVAHKKGLTPAQAKRLVGSTPEELEADADDFLESIKPPDEKAPTGKPRERLTGGGDPTEEPEADIRKVVDAIPRSF